MAAMEMRYWDLQHENLLQRVQMTDSPDFPSALWTPNYVCSDAMFPQVLLGDWAQHRSCNMQDSSNRQFGLKAHLDMVETFLELCYNLSLF